MPRWGLSTARAGWPKILLGSDTACLGELSDTIGEGSVLPDCPSLCQIPRLHLHLPLNNAGRVEVPRPSPALGSIDLLEWLTGSREALPLPAY